MYNGKSLQYKGQGTVTPPPTPTCSDGVQNGDETGIDCGGSCSPCSEPPTGSGNPNWFEEPTATAPSIVTTYTPTSGADLSNAANANKIAIISNSFSATGVTLAAGQIIRPAGGVITGTNINLNDAYIEEDNYQQVFSGTATFTSVYDKSYVTLENFGAISNDGIDDGLAIHTTMKYCKYVKLKPNSTYTKNSSSFINRDGQYSMIGSNSKIEVTNDAAIDAKTAAYIFWTLNLSVRFVDIEIDGNGLYGQVFSIAAPEAYHIEDLNVHDFYTFTGQAERAVAFRFELYNVDDPENYVFGEPFGTGNTITTKFKNGYAKNNIIKDFDIEGNCAFNDGIGISKAFWFLFYQIDPLELANIYHTGNLIENIEGEDAEGIYLNDETWSGGGKVITHQIYSTFYRDTIINCSRRAIKSVMSNVTLEECVFKMPLRNQATNALASMVDFFTLVNAGNPTPNANDYSENILVKNCQFIQEEYLEFYDINSGCTNGTGPNGELFVPDVPLLSLGNVRDFVIDGNTFDRPRVDNYGSIMLGSSGSIGKMGVGNIKNNTYYNGGIDVANAYNGIGLLTIENEIFIFDDFSNGNGGGSHAAFRLLSTSDAFDNVRLRNSAITFTWSSTPPTNGLFVSKGGGIANSEINNVTVTYTNNNAGSQPNFGLIQNLSGSHGNYDSTNSIIDCTLVGSSGENSLSVAGTDKSVVITNSFGDGATPITVQ